MSHVEHVQWHRAAPVDGDPYWYTTMHGLDLLVSVPIGCPWAWEWSVTSNDALPEGGIESETHTL